MPIVLSNCSNNYGSNQFPEKLIPVMITKIRKEEELHVYGKGDNIRDWLWVIDHCTAIDAIYHKGRLGETYNIGGKNERTKEPVSSALPLRCDGQKAGSSGMQL